MSGMAFGGADEGESGGLIARASDIAQGLNYPKTAFFHIAFKTAASERRTLTAAGHRCGRRARLQYSCTCRHARIHTHAHTHTHTHTHLRAHTLAGPLIPAAARLAAAVLIYMFGSWFSSNFVNIFVLCVLMLAFDFWTVKNVSGRRDAARPPALPPRRGPVASSPPRASPKRVPRPNRRPSPRAPTP